MLFAFNSSLAAIALLATTTATFANVVFTPTEGSNCRTISKEPVSEWVCSGPDKLVARFSDEGNMVAVAIGRGPLANKRLEAVSNFRGAGPVFGKKIEWHLVNGKPRSAVLRVFQLETMKNGDEQQVQKLEVYAINNRVTCLFASVDATEPDANAKAAAHAESATRWACTEK